MGGLSSKILESVAQVGRPVWDEVFADIPEGYGFYKTLEESGLKEFTFLYAVLYRDGQPVLIAPLFIGDFYPDIALEGAGQNIIRAVRKIFPRFLVFRTLFCGSPFGENGVIGIRPGAANREELILELADVLARVGRERRAPAIMFKDVLAKDLPLLGRLKDRGFFNADSFPSTVADLPFSSMDGYLASLSHATRKNLRRKLRAAHGVTVKIVDRIEGLIEDVYKLYWNTYTAGAVRFETLTKEFFLAVARNMPSQTLFFLYYVEGKLAAFNLCFRHDGILIDKFIGFDYAYARKYNLYFFSWYYNVEWCLKNGIHSYQVGQTDYGPKLKLGGRLVPLSVLVRHRNGLLNFIFRTAARFLEPSGFDESARP